MPLILLKLKSWLLMAFIIIVITAISYGYYWHRQYNKSQVIIAQQIKQNAICEANQQLLKSGVQRWKAAASQYEHKLKLKDEQVAKRTKESHKRLSSIMQHQFSSDCNQAIKEGLQFYNLD